MGLLTVGLPALLVYFTLLLCTNSAFVIIIRYDWNLQFQDPGMTFTQIGCGILWGMFLLAQTNPDARGSILLLFVTAFFFGIFRLSTRQFLLLMLLASAAYGSLIISEWQMMDMATRRTGITQWLFLTVVLLWMSFMGGYVARLRANLRQAMIKIERLAHQDDLTGTSNRRAITGSLDDALKQARETQAPLSLCMLDLDNFKRINDRHGHLAGDEILREFVNRITHHLRWADFVHNKGVMSPDEPEALGRFGGEEFLVILPDTDIGGAEQAAERLRAAICNEAFITEAGKVHVSVSIGITSYTDGDNDNDLLRRADKALYKSKQQGRNRVTVDI